MTGFSQYLEKWQWICIFTIEIFLEVMEFLQAALVYILEFCSMFLGLAWICNWVLHEYVIGSCIRCNIL
jgi:uncharacterized membrane protein AbrB (regulator of aidB expression)